MNGIEIINRRTEEEYVDEYISRYPETLTTPDGFIVDCPRRAGKHICYGKAEIFNKGRASRILWPKYILLNPELRKILVNTNNNNIVFVYDLNKITYLVICVKNKKNDKLRLITAYPISGKRQYTIQQNMLPYKIYV